jgi:hypothetical protein
MEAIDSAMYIEKRARHASGMLKDRRLNRANHGDGSSDSL